MTPARRAELLSAGFAPAGSPTIPCSKAPENRPIVAYKWKSYRAPQGKVSRPLNPILVSLAADEAARRAAAERFTRAILSPGATDHNPPAPVKRTRKTGRHRRVPEKEARSSNLSPSVCTAPGCNRIVRGTPGRKFTLCEDHRSRPPGTGEARIPPTSKPPPQQGDELEINVLSANSNSGARTPRTTAHRRRTSDFKKAFGPRRHGQAGICKYSGCSNEKALVYDGRPARFCRFHLDRYLHSTGASRCAEPGCRAFAGKFATHCHEHAALIPADPEAVGF